MSESAVATDATRTDRSTLGSFVVGPRVIDAQKRLGTTLIVSVAGQEGTPFASRNGLAYCTKLSGDDDATLEAARERLARIAALRHESLVPVLETGLAGTIAFLIDAPGAAERLVERLAHAGRMPVWRVARYLHQIAVAVQLAHHHQTSHGAISTFTVWIDDAEHVRLGGFGPWERGAGTDQAQLAALAFELLTGERWSVGGEEAASGTALIERVRTGADGMSERVATVIARGLEWDPALQYRSVEAFDEAFADAVTLSAQEIAAGAWEAVSRQDLGMAAILSRLVASYDPNSPDIPLLDHRLSGASAVLPFAPSLPAQPERRALTEPVPASASFVSGVNGAVFTEEEMRRVFGLGEIDQTVTRGNPWVIFLAVVFGMIAVMAALAALAFNQT